MVTTIIPTMHITTPLLHEPEEKIIYVLRYFTSIPSSIFITYKEEEISAKQLMAQYSKDPHTLCSNIGIVLKDVYERIFPEEIIDIDCSPEYRDESKTNYDIFLDIKIYPNENSLPYNYSDILHITEDKMITFKPTR
jgi:hypothetical protein